MVAQWLSFFMYVCYAGVLAKASRPDLKVPNKKYFNRVFDEIKAKNIEKNLRYFTEYPHHAGSNRTKELADHIVQEWNNSGFDKTEIFRYNVYLSYPTKPGEITLRKGGDVKKKFVIENEPAYHDSERKGKILLPYNAYSPKATVTAEYVYCNYGEHKDFETLKRLGVDLKGKILIFRYGNLYRGSKVRLAELYGAVGVILYTDPYDFTISGNEYPNGWTLNRDGIQRGTINRNSGDSLSIGYPSKANYWRKSEKKYSGNSKIPSQPIGFGTAYEILKSMKNDSISLPSGFQGGLNITYVLSSGKGQTLTLKVSTHLETRESETVCTTLYGKHEPDRYVLIGNHRDSWSYGASDASSGTSSIVEIVRAIGEVKRSTGWRPARSLMACSWGAEEPGTLGSTEWTDEHHKFISEHVVTYVNADMVVDGNYTVGLRALDIITEGVYRASKLIHPPYKPSKTLYEDWLEKQEIVQEKKLSNPGSTFPEDISDFDAFWLTHGTTITDIGYVLSEKEYPRFASVSQYHTRYDSISWMKKYIDPDLAIHLAVAQLCAGQIMLFSDLQILPFNLVGYTKQVRRFLNQLESFYKPMLMERGITLEFAKERLNELRKKAEKFHHYIKHLDLTKATIFQVRSINDKLMRFERNFILPDIVANKATRHVIYGATPHYLELSKFPGITEAIYFASKNPDDDWDEVRKQITLLIWCFDTANRSLHFDEWEHHA